MLSVDALALAHIRTTEPPRKVILLDCEHNRLPFDRIRCSDLKSIGQAWMDLPRQQGESLPRWHTFNPAEFTMMLDKICVLRVEDWRNHRLEFSLYGGVMQPSSSAVAASW